MGKLSSLSYILTIIAGILGLITFLWPTQLNSAVEGNYLALIVGFFILLIGGAIAGIKGKTWGKYLTVTILALVGILGIMAGTAGLVFIVPSAILIMMIFLSK